MILNASATPRDTTADEVEVLLAELESRIEAKFTALTNTINTFPKGSIKSVQRGLATPSGDGNTTITISSVNPNKCLVLLHGSRTGSSYATFTPTLVSLTATVLTVSKSGQSISGNFNVHEFSWQVIEFY